MTWVVYTRPSWVRAAKGLSSRSLAQAAEPPSQAASVLVLQGKRVFGGRLERSLGRSGKLPSASQEIKARFGKHVLEPGKTRGWKQDELGKKLATSGVVVGRHERGEMMPSIEVAQKMAEVFGVIADYLVGERGVPNLPSQSDMVERWTTLDGLPAEDRDRILSFVDSLIREAKTRRAFRPAS